MTAKRNWRRARPRTGISVLDEAERLDRDAAARWLSRNQKKSRRKKTPQKRKER